MNSHKDTDKLKHLLVMAKGIEKHWEDVGLRESSLEIFKKILEHEKWDIDQETKKKLASLINKNITYKHFISSITPLERALANLEFGEKFKVAKIDRELSEVSQNSGNYVIADNIRSAHNIGSIIRTSECFAVKHIFLCGYTEAPESERIKKTTMGAEKYISWSWERSCLETMALLREQGILLVGLETVEDSKCLNELENDKNYCLIVGNERHGLDAAILNECDYIVNLPMLGRKNSLNVSVALGIGLWLLN